MRYLRSSLLLSLAASGSLLMAQAKKPAAAPAPAPAPAAPAADAAPVDDITVIKAIPYNPDIKRDPFETPSDQRPANQQDSVDDCAVKGVVRQNGKMLAVCSDSRGNVNWLDVGHQFRDGVIVAIDDKGVTFHQWEANTTNKSIYRVVTKTFKPEVKK